MTRKEFNVFIAAIMMSNPSLLAKKCRHKHDCKGKGYYARQRENKIEKEYGVRIKGKPVCSPEYVIDDDSDTCLQEMCTGDDRFINEMDPDLKGMTISMDANGTIGVASYNARYKGMTLREEAA